ncbi:MAG: hypothetical protein FK734_14320 [Asgard group archaeon]|nr:hypothetical protein [Asgard group archaeon]
MTFTFNKQLTGKTGIKISLVAFFFIIMLIPVTSISIGETNAKATINMEIDQTSLSQILEPNDIVYDWLIMIYLDGDNNLEDVAIDDFNELEEGFDPAQDIKILVLIDRAVGYDTSNGDWTGTRLYQITYDDTSTITSTLIEDKGELNMGSGAVLEDFVEYCLTSTDAQNYWLNLWDHGGGVDGICWDDTSSPDALYMDEMQQAIANAENTTSKTIDLISHDACHMGMIEVACELEGLCDYFVASEESIPGAGFDYLAILDDLNLDPTMDAATLADVIVDSYESFYSSTSYVTLSVLNVSLMADLKYYMNNLSELLENIVLDGYGSYLEDAFFEALTFYGDYQIDLVHLVELIQAETTLDANYGLLSTSTQNVLDTLSDMIIRNFQDSVYAGNANGVAIFMPYYNSIYDPYIDAYIATSSYYANMDWQNDTYWDEFLDTFYDAGFGEQVIGMEELTLGVATGSQAIASGEDAFYYFEATEYGIYQITMTVSSCDVDVYLTDITVTDVYGWSELYNPEDGNTETIQLDLAAGQYAVYLFSYGVGYYNLEVNQVTPTTIVVGGSEIHSSNWGTQEGDDYYHYSQLVLHYYQATFTETGEYTIYLTYNSGVVDFDLYLLTTNFLEVDNSISTGSQDSITIDIDSETTYIICVYGYSGYGSFTLWIEEGNGGSLSPAPTTTGLFSSFTTILTILGILGLTFSLKLLNRKK